MLPSAGHLLSALALGTLAVPVSALKFNFTTVRQCAPVNITFSGSNLAVAPTFLTIVPLESNAIVVPLQNPALISTGISLTFLPLAAGSNFLASLDDVRGENLISVSDLIRVLPSSGDNSSCLPNPENDTPRRFTIGETVSQCEDFTVIYDTVAVSKAPSVRLYSPRGPSFLLNNTSDDPATGLATYTMNFSRGREVVLLIDDGGTFRETSSLLTVGGDSSSSKACLQHNINGNTTNTATSASSADTPRISKAVIIGAATGGVAVITIALGMVIFVIRDRRRRRKKQVIEFNPSAMEKAADNNDTEKGATGQATVIAKPPRSTAMGMVSNPIYTTSSFLSVEKSIKSRGSMASWAQVVSEDQGYTNTQSRSSNAISPTTRMSEFNSNIIVVPPESPQRDDRSRSSLDSLDIEGMLNMASIQADGIPGSRKNSDVTPFGPIMRAPSLTVPNPTYPRNPTGRRHNRDPSDVPAGPDSMLFSGYSVTPTESTFQEPLRTGDSLRSPGGSELPKSPFVIRPRID
ncbi:hypothetical protein BDN70DRAFT_918407 [Pholiota conissans]|uniref:Uncharacterized protein n=1 Tax=Pholiota conissans TaxID=109636 RepID=A0A9P6D4Y0_9AGAR|nr:hypothetical protein BDN70DRAFT_918407 [Pholiota conissans]